MADPKTTIIINLSALAEPAVTQDAIPYSIGMHPKRLAEHFCILIFSESVL